MPKSLTRYLPILSWGRSYNRAALGNDLIAALIVTIMLIPQSLAYALLAGLPPEAGLYASIAPKVDDDEEEEDLNQRHPHPHPHPHLRPHPHPHPRWMMMRRKKT